MDMKSLDNDQHQKNEKKSLKETYFTPPTILERAINMQKWLAEFSRRRPANFIPKRSALLLLDMQEYFLNESSHAFVPSATAIIPGINALINSYCSLNLPVIFTRHLNTPKDAGLMAVWWRELLGEHHPLSKIDPRLESQNGVTIIKTQYDAFLDSPLQKLLLDLEVSQVVICGVMTHLCCETTARSAFMRGFEVFFTIDGTATYNEDFHRATLLNLSHGFATPALVREIQKKLEIDLHG